MNDLTKVHIKERWGGKISGESARKGPQIEKLGHQQLN